MVVRARWLTMKLVVVDGRCLVGRGKYVGQIQWMSTRTDLGERKKILENLLCSSRVLTLSILCCLDKMEDVGPLQFGQNCIVGS